MLVFRAVSVWLVLLVVAVLNGAIRAVLLEPRMTDLQAHQISCLTGSGLILTLTCLLSRWLNTASVFASLLVGLLWAGLTVAFEFAFGRFVAQATWDRLLADYNLRAGRLWVLVLATILFAPLVGSAFRSGRLSNRR